MAASRTQRSYDHRLVELVRATGDPTLATRLGVPRSTAAGWVRAPRRSPVLLPDEADTSLDLESELARLRRRVRRLAALVRVLLAFVRAFRIHFAGERVPGDRDKRRLLRAIGHARRAFALRRILRTLRLSESRYHAWRRRACPLEDRSSCPRSSPQQLTPNEIRRIREMATSPEYRHVPTGTLARLAQRMGAVFASPTTWHRLIRDRGWRRPRIRIHPDGPKVGIRASKPDEIWHVDTTVIRLLDGIRAYLHAAIDNFSRRILAWRLAEHFDPANAVAVLLEAGAAREAARIVPTVVADAGVENRNGDIDRLIASGLLRRVLAMTELSFSNSMIEAWWRVLKHQWLFLNSIDSIGKLRGLVEFYVREHNARLPHSAFRGQTPDEMYFGTGDGVPAQLEAGRAAAREARLRENRKQTCSACAGDPPEDFVAA